MNEAYDGGLRQSLCIYISTTGRPVASSVNCHTNTISKYVDLHLQPIAKNISYVRGTTDFLRKLDKVKNIPNECLLVTLDVKSLYTNIPNNEGIEAVVFNAINYLQIMGCAMGTICAPAYANIFVAQFEKRHKYSYIKNKSILYLRYINDIFMIWTGTKQELIIFLENLNSKRKTIKFEHNISHRNISFLDTLIYKDMNNTLHTTLY